MGAERAVGWCKRVVVAARAEVVARVLLVLVAKVFGGEKGFFCIGKGFRGVPKVREVVARGLVAGAADPVQLPLIGACPAALGGRLH